LPYNRGNTFYSKFRLSDFSGCKRNVPLHKTKKLHISVKLLAESRLSREDSNPLNPCYLEYYPVAFAAIQNNLSYTFSIFSP
jgi:hypothetical protein